MTGVALRKALLRVDQGRQAVPKSADGVATNLAWIGLKDLGFGGASMPLRPFHVAGP